LPPLLAFVACEISCRRPLSHEIAWILETAINFHSSVISDAPKYIYTYISCHVNDCGSNVTVIISLSPPRWFSPWHTRN
jgi:hypothetical protein